MCIVLICSTYGYFSIRISSITPTGDLNKHKVATSTSMSSMGDPNKPKSVIGISNYISSLYEYMKILISAIVIRLL